MHFYHDNNRKRCVIEHKGEKQYWTTTIYGRTSLYKMDDDVFGEFNIYLSRLSEHEQDKLWQIYVELEDIVNSVFELAILRNEMETKVSEIYQIINYQEIRSMILNLDSVIVPEQIPEVHTGDEKLIDSTYVRDDYMDLLAYMVTLRPLIPIWGSYIDIIKSSTSNTYKEYFALHVLNKTNLLNIPPVNRLYVYIDSRLKASEDTGAAVIDGLSSEETSDYTFANLTIRRLAVGNINIDSESGHIVSNIYNYISSNSNSNDRKFGGARNKQRKSDLAGSSEDESSLIELYKINSKATMLDIETSNVYALNTIKVATDIDPTVPEELVMQCRRDIVYSIHKFHIVIVQWMVHKVMPVQAVESLSNHSLMSLIAVTQALLWHWELPYLALLMTSSVDNSDMDMYIPPQTNSRIKTPELEKLKELYPYSKGDANSRKSNPAANAIAELHRLIAPRIWISHHPEFMNEFHNAHKLINEGLPHDNIMTPSDLMPSLADLVIKLNN